MKFLVDAGLIYKDFLSLPSKSYLTIMPFRRRSDIVELSIIINHT